MNEQEIKAALLQLEHSEKPFSVLFTGKLSKKAGSRYSLNDSQIILHNRTFTAPEQLFAAAIREYARHLAGNSGPAVYRVHHDRLIAKARQSGAITIQTGGIQAQVDACRELLAEHAKLERTIGQKLAELQRTCKASGIDFDIVTDHELKIARKTRKRCMEAGELQQLELFDGITADQQAAISKAQTTQRADVAEKVREAPTAAAADAVTKAKPPADPDSPIVLQKEIKRIEKTIASLLDKKTHIEERLEAMDTAPVFKLEGGKISEVPA